MPTRALTPLQRSLVSVFGLGRLRPASGTWGSLPPVALVAWLSAMGVCPACGGVLSVGWLVYYGSLVVTLVVFAGACVLFGDAAEAEYAEPDPSNVVADETAGMALTLLFLPAAAWTGGPLWTLAALALAFVLWRIMDILKPWPAGSLQRIPGGWGILLDDLMAAVYAGALTLVIVRAFWP
jgi:phosphatidylglycerophosphatase A